MIVAFAGPPLVRLTDSSNNCNVPFVDMIAVSKSSALKAGWLFFLVSGNMLLRLSLLLHIWSTLYFEARKIENHIVARPISKAEQL